ncbi:MAG: SAM-dependent methyltransferase [Acidobacteriota bacterium]|nr:SAM-dependent methyltransferase [Acidobacteriota bacterium]
MIGANEQPPRGANEHISLAERLRERIARGGPITFRDWMEAALYDARGGYYSRRDLSRWGRAGDYRTSPERTPLFAATFARYFASLHEQLGSPARFTICEAGAGAGDFALNTLSALERDFPRAFAATRYVAEEIGEHSRASAREKLAPFADRVEFRDPVEQKPERAGEFRAERTREGRVGRTAEERGEQSVEPTRHGVVFSNELIDALPVHRAVMSGGRLRELLVGLDADGRFAWVEGEPSTPRLAEHFARFGIELREGQRAEVNLACERWLARAASMFERGFVVTVDYGATAVELYDPRLRFGGTLRAFRSHALSGDLLAEPGAQDLTATINWSQLELAGRAAGLETVAFERLDRFMLRAGALEQLEIMSGRAATEGERAALRVGAREMILPGGMAESFQVLVQKK